MEAVVSLLVLVIVMVVTLGLLFSMRSFAERQTSKTAPRQTARQAIDYVSFFAGGASDLNQGGIANNPNAIVTYWVDGGGTVKQASYNNLTTAQEGAGLGAAGTDILTVFLPVNPTPIPVSSWAGFNVAGKSNLNYVAGCGSSSAQNNALFKAATGAHVETAFGASEVSDLLIATNPTGAWGYYRITSYDSAPDCTRAGAAIQVVSNATSSQQVANPAGQPSLADPVSLIAGLQIVSFRVRQDANGTFNLEQKQGLFNPATDNPGTAFVPVVEDVEDLQVAWLYNQALAGGATIFGTATTPFPVTVTNGVPSQGGRGGDAAYDVTRIAGLRISIVARSKALRFGSLRLTASRGPQPTPNPQLKLAFRPAVEDRAAGAVDGFDHQRITTTVMLRNRMLGN